MMDHSEQTGHKMNRNGSNKPLTKRSLAAACRSLAGTDPIFRRVHETYGTPPLWDRPANFATLLQIILEQQVSLASAKACFDKLSARLGEVTPERLLKLTDAELRTDGFSRQKTAYGRHLSEAILNGDIDLPGLSELSDTEVKAALIKLKGIGEWTSDIYLLMALLRSDVMPKGDIALHAAYQKLTGIDKRPHSEEFLVIAERWKPFRSAAARLLWHFYLCEKKNGTRINAENGGSSLI
jgi:DNA-3-methyladenine glycosylase II